MHHSRIDDLTRCVAQRTGRRTATAGILGALLATMLPGPIVPSSRARKNRRLPRCRKPKRRCGKKCVNVKNNRRHCGTCNRRCKPGHACRRGTCTPPPCGKGGPCLAFLTSSVHGGELGGLSGGDTICNQRASAAGLPGNYRAWLSDSVNSPATRFTQNPGPYVLPNGVRIANTWADMIDDSLLAPLNVMEDGGVQAGMTNVWTGTSGTGKQAAYHCDGWTNTFAFGGVYGRADATNSGWSVAGAFTCGSGYRLYCFQQS